MLSKTATFPVHLYVVWTLKKEHTNHQSEWSDNMKFWKVFFNSSAANPSCLKIKNFYVNLKIKLINVNGIYSICSILNYF